jgi:hypothetical protein
MPDIPPGRRAGAGPLAQGGSMNPVRHTSPGPANGHRFAPGDFVPHQELTTIRSQRIAYPTRAP